MSVGGVMIVASPRCGWFSISHVVTETLRDFVPADEQEFL
jgi:hypothetical protein